MTRFPMPPLQTKSPIVSIGHADNKDAAILEQLQESLFLHVTQKNGQNEEPGSCERPPRHARGCCAAWKKIVRAPMTIGTRR